MVISTKAAANVRDSHHERAISIELGGWMCCGFILL
jgi:hypothetical protein